MRWSVALRIGLTALRRNRMRTALTVLGTIIGVAAVIGIAALGAGARGLARIRRFGGYRYGIGAVSGEARIADRSDRRAPFRVAVTAPFLMLQPAENPLSAGWRWRLAVATVEDAGEVGGKGDLVTGSKWPALLCAFVVAAIGSTTAAQAGRDASSVARAADLMSLMQAKGLQTFAVRVPDQPDHFAAVMAFPEVQLLVVAARHANPDWLAAQVAQKQFREVYSELQSATSQASRIFIQDLGGDGLGGRGGVDVLYERGVQTLFDGNWKRARLSREAYDTRLAAADKRYSELLDALINGLKGS